jgi:hypothetical protein
MWSFPPGRSLEDYTQGNQEDVLEFNEYHCRSRDGKNSWENIM